MAVPLAAFQDAVPRLQEIYNQITGAQPYKLEIKPISGTDIYYTDGDAQYWTGKIAFINPKTNLDDKVYYFTPAGLTRVLRSPSLDPLNDWIKSVVDVYNEQSKQTSQS
jgi:hypothetical protein